MDNPYEAPDEPQNASVVTVVSESSDQIHLVAAGWPLALQAGSFLLYAFSVRDFYATPSVGLELLYIPTLLACIFVFPGVAMGQLAYGCFVLLRRKKRQGWLHVGSSIGVWALLGMFLMFVSAGYIITV